MYNVHREEEIIIADRKPFDQGKYIQEFMKEKYVRISVLLNKVTDADIIGHLKTVGNKSQYVKNLIRKDIHRT